MSSIIKVDQIQLADGSTPTAGDLGISGGLLQTVDQSYSANKSTTSTSYVASGIKASITPSSTSSKIMVNIATQVTSILSAENARFVVYRDGSANSPVGDQATMLTNQSAGDNNHTWCPMTLIYIDEPATTSEIEYELYYRSNTGGTVYASWEQGRQIIILQEIAG